MEKGHDSSAKSIDPGQPAQSAQGSILFAMVHVFHVNFYSCKISTLIIRIILCFYNLGDNNLSKTIW